MESNVDNSVTSIIVFGASGRMGTRIVSLGAGDPAFEIRAAIVRESSSRAGSSMSVESGGRARGVTLQSVKNIEKTAVFADVVIDFSSDAGAMESLSIARRAKAAPSIQGKAAPSPANSSCTMRRPGSATTE